MTRCTCKVSFFLKTFFLYAVISVFFQPWARAQKTHLYMCEYDTMVYPQQPDGRMYYIDFGDGHADSSYLPMRHVYAGKGTYPVMVRRDGNMLPGLLCMAEVGNLPKAAFSPEAHCYRYNFKNAAPDSVQVNGGWLWDFGDGTTSAERSPAHLYAGPGDYHVSLQSGRTCHSIVSHTIHIEEALQPGFNLHVSGSSALFQPRDTTNAVYLWNFGDNHQSDSVMPRHTFTGVGKFPVTLITESTSGCTLFYVDTITATSAGIQLAEDDNSNVFKAFPNPFSERLTIHYELTGPRQVSLKLFDATGREAATLYQGLQHAGRYDINISPEEKQLKSGMYFLYAVFGEVNFSEPLILQR